MSQIVSKNITVTTTTNLANKISAYAQKIMQERADRAIKAGEQAAKDTIEKVIKENRVYRSLRGEFANYGQGYDLQAEFGLTQSIALRATDRMVQILRDTVRSHFQREPRNSKLSLTGKITALDPADYENQLKNYSEFRYISINKLARNIAQKRKRKAEGIEIRWMEWLLEAKNPSIINSLLPSISGYGITYDITSRSAVRSRSGRALMRQISLRRNRHLNPYKMPKLAIPQIGSSKNFIEDISKDRRFVAHLGKQVHKAVYRVMKPNQPLPGYLRD